MLRTHHPRRSDDAAPDQPGFGRLTHIPDSHHQRWRASGYSQRSISAEPTSTVTTDRHARCSADLAGELQWLQRAEDLASALAGLDKEQDNFLASLRFAIDTGDA